MSTIEITAGAGLKKALILELGSDGYPEGATAGDNGYFGEDMTGVQSVSTNVPEPQRVNHPGDDQVFAQDTLAPNELPSGTIATGKTNQTLDAILTKALVQTVGDGKLSPQFTNRQGDEQQVMLVYYRQALDTDPDSSSFGARKYQTHIVPSCRIVPMGNGQPAQGSADTNNYSVAMTRVTETPWGVALSENDNGATSAAKLLYTGDYPWIPAHFIGNNTVTTFTLPYRPISVAKTQAWNSSGSALTVASVDTTNRTATLSPAPGNNVEFMIWFETDEAIV